ncbi:MAG: NAD(P)-dependent oxidoreductase [bacterium]|nr:NAD(P)-dependent oxidoreductase [bacterium]MDE0290760.1 NAD(P)-dependent oxidoreductase [bacterium]MDE0440064.1 NAD(P)-dependent oxidoreductase [bacterium]
MTPMPTVGWVGTGVMGASMCGHILDAGYRVTVTTRTKTKAMELIDRGASWADSPAEVAAASDISCAIVGFPDDVREVFLGPSGLLAGASAGDILVDMTTSEPALAIEIAERAGVAGVAAIDAPVSGGDIGARNGTLSIMIGGSEEAVERARPIFETMGKTIVRQGGPGAGQHTKAINQILIATLMIGLSEALLYGRQAGLDLDTVMESVSGGAAGSWSLTNYGPRILRGDFEPGFFVDHFVKDMGIALSEAASMKLPAPGLALAHELYVSLQAQGLGRKGTQSLILALARMAGLEWNPR